MSSNFRLGDVVASLAAKRTLALLALLLPLLAVPALAGSQTSADYAVRTAVLDAGGQRASAADYANDGSIGAIGHLSAIGATTARSGFPGQLYDLSNALVVILAPATIDEGTTRQLAVQGVADDTTLVDLTLESVSWSSIGPVSITVGGSVIGGAVHEDTAATAIATRSGATGQLALTVINTLPDNFGLYAGDELDDAWQIHFFGLDNPDGAATADADADGQNNRIEFLAQTLPNDPLSHLRLRIENWIGGKKALVFSPYAAGRNYAIEWTADFIEWFALEPFSEGDLAVEHYIIDKDAQEPRRFYRLKISR